MPALLLLQRGMASVPLLAASALTVLNNPEQSGVGPIPNGFYFAFIQKTSAEHLVKAEERTLEKGVQFHDHAQDRGSTLELVVHLHGNYMQRNGMYHMLKVIKDELRKDPGSLVTSDPLEIFPAVVLETFRVQTEDDTFYDMTGRVAAPFQAYLQFRLVRILGSDSGRGSAPSPIGNFLGDRALPKRMTHKEIPNLPE